MRLVRAISYNNYYLSGCNISWRSLTVISDTHATQTDTVSQHSEASSLIDQKNIVFQNRYVIDSFKLSDLLSLKLWDRRWDEVLLEAYD